MIKIKDESGKTIFVVSDDGSEPIQIKVRHYHPFVTTIADASGPSVCAECGMPERHEIHHYHETKLKEENK